MGVGGGLVEVGAEGEVATIITIMVAMHQSTQARCTMSNPRHHIATGADDILMTINMDLPRTPLGHRHHHINTGRDTDQADPGRTHRNQHTAEARLTQMVVAETHRGRCLVRITGADITLDPRAEAVTVGAVAVAEVEVEVGEAVTMPAAAAAVAEAVTMLAAAAVVGEGGTMLAVAAVLGEGDTMLAAAAVLGVVMVMAATEATQEEDSEMPHRIRAATTLVSMMVATAQAAVVRHEGAVGVEVTDLLANIRTRA